MVVTSGVIIEKEFQFVKIQKFCGWLRVMVHKWIHNSVNTLNPIELYT